MFITSSLTAPSGNLHGTHQGVPKECFPTRQECRQTQDATALRWVTRPGICTVDVRVRVHAGALRQHMVHPWQRERILVMGTDVEAA